MRALAWWLQTAVMATALPACEAPAAPPNGKYTVGGTAVGSSQVPGRDACTWGAWIYLDTPFAGYWKGTTTLGFGRLFTRNGHVVSQDTNYRLHPAELRQQGADSIVLSLTGPIALTFSAARQDSYSFDGDWVCDNRFPFADDSSKPNPGRWGVVTY
jgi:hypothetical protein